MSGPVCAKFLAQEGNANMPGQQQHALTPYGQEPRAIVIILATLAGNEYHMPANLAHYEDLSQLEEDIVSFLPTVSDLEVLAANLTSWYQTRNCPCKIPYTLRSKNTAGSKSLSDPAWRKGTQSGSSKIAIGMVILRQGGSSPN